MTLSEGLESKPGFLCHRYRDMNGSSQFSPRQLLRYWPVNEASGILGSIAGIGELFKEKAAAKTE
jgi:hypothetical protein